MAEVWWLSPLSLRYINDDIWTWITFFQYKVTLYLTYPISASCISHLNSQTNGNNLICTKNFILEIKMYAQLSVNWRSQGHTAIFLEFTFR